MLESNNLNSFIHIWNKIFGAEWLNRWEFTRFPRTIGEASSFGIRLSAGSSHNRFSAGVSQIPNDSTPCIGVLI